MDLEICDICGRNFEDVPFIGVRIHGKELCIECKTEYTKNPVEFVAARLDIFDDPDDRPAGFKDPDIIYDASNYNDIGRIGSYAFAVCKTCGTEFTYEYRGGPLRHYCAEHSPKGVSV